MVGEPLSFKCPVSSEPYAYDSKGLSAPGVLERLIIYDTQPVHNGHRWGIVMIPSQPEQPITVSVIPLPESRLNAYLHK
jgi:hypothetical protein